MPLSAKEIADNLAEMPSVAPLSPLAVVGYCQCSAAIHAGDYECAGCGREANPPTNTHGEIGEPS